MSTDTEQHFPPFSCTWLTWRKFGKWSGGVFQSRKCVLCGYSQDSDTRAFKCIGTCVLMVVLGVLIVSGIQAVFS